MNYCPHCMKPATGEVCPSCGGQVHWQAPANQLPVGTLLRSPGGHIYQIGAAKGQGGFGITYAALDLMNQNRVAIKEYFPSRSASRDNVTRVICATGQMEGFRNGLRSFLEEAKMLSAVGALDSVVSIRDFFEGNGTAYIVMEYVDGIPLHEVVRRQGKMSQEELFAILPVLLRDIGILHRAGVIHRDISPDNLILTKQGKLKLLDFGSARSMETGKAMTVMLKAGFSPVEQYQSKGQGPYTDVYAMAGTIYYCLTGVVPPTAIDRITQDELRAPNALGAGLTQQQQDALLWGMTVQPQSRPQNMEAFSNAMFPGSIPQSSVHTGQNPGQTNHIPGQTNHIPGQTGQTPGYTGHTPGYTGQTPGYTGHTPGYTGQTPGYTGHTPGYMPQPPKKSFGKGLFVGIGAAVAAVVLLVMGILISSAVNGNKKTTPDKREEPDTYIQDEPAVISGLTTPTAPAQPSRQEETTEDGYVYRIENGAAVITGYVGDSSSLTFPDHIDGCDVTVLEEGCLAGNTVVRSILLPLYCEEIRANAFYGCTNLRVINCYSTIYADASAFTGCTKLRAVKRFAEDSISTWKLPADCRVYVTGTEIGIGTLSLVNVDDNGVIYGFTSEDDYAVILDVPRDITYLTVPETFWGSPVMWVWEGALDNASGDLTIFMCPDMGFDFTLLDLATWDCKSLDSFCYSWGLTCEFCRDINANRPNTDPILPDRMTVQAAMIRSMELVEDYSYDRPNGGDWGDLLSEMGVDWDYAYAQNEKIDCSAADFENQLDAAFAEIQDIYAGTHQTGDYYSGLGVGIFMGETGYIYMHAIGIL